MREVETWLRVSVRWQQQTEGGVPLAAWHHRGVTERPRGVTRFRSVFSLDGCTDAFTAFSAALHSSHPQTHTHCSVDILLFLIWYTVTTISTSSDFYLLLYLFCYSVLIWRYTVFHLICLLCIYSTTLYTELACMSFWRKPLLDFRLQSIVLYLSSKNPVSANDFTLFWMFVINRSVLYVLKNMILLLQLNKVLKTLVD